MTDLTALPTVMNSQWEITDILVDPCTDIWTMFTTIYTAFAFKSPNLDLINVQIDTIGCEEMTTEFCIYIYCNMYTIVPTESGCRYCCIHQFVKYSRRSFPFSQSKAILNYWNEERKRERESDRETDREKEKQKRENRRTRQNTAFGISTF